MRLLRHRGGHILPDPQRLIIGATTEEAGFAAEPTAKAAVQFDEQLRRLLSARLVRSEQRAGLRPKPKGGRPLIGPLADQAHIFVATGHYKNGILMGPLTGELIAGWICDGKPARAMDRFAVDR